jgi:DNA polymerase
MMFGDPIEAVVNGLRHAIVAAPGHLLEVGDFMQVEARIVLALAGQYDKCALMAAGASPYIPMAESIFKRKIDKHVDIKEYTIGKNTVLGCGFQMGAAKFRARYCPKESMEFAQNAIDTYRKVFAPEVPKLWTALQDAATACVWNRKAYEAYGIRYELEDGWMTCRLPSGRKLWYYDPKPVRRAMPWDANDVRQGLEYSAFKGGIWKRVAAYGGLLTENVVQATARDMLVNALFTAEANGHPVVLTVHDEGVNEVPERMADAKLMNQFMCEQPAWVRSLQIPVGADCWVGDRYRK